jgi:hypothetical protein
LHGGQLYTHPFFSSHYIAQISSARKQKQTIKDSAPIYNPVQGHIIAPASLVGAPMTPENASGRHNIAFGSPITPSNENGTASQVRSSVSGMGMGMGIGLGAGADGGQGQSSVRKLNGDATVSSRPSKRHKSKCVRFVFWSAMRFADKENF